MRPIAIALTDTFPYVLEENREDPEEEQTVFHLRPPTVQEDEKYLNNSGQLAKIGTKAHEMLKDHLKGWENFPGPDGELVEFQASGSKDKPTDQTISRIALRHRIELMNAITARGREADSEEVKGK